MELKQIPKELVLSKTIALEVKTSRAKKIYSNVYIYFINYEAVLKMSNFAAN